MIFILCLSFFLNKPCQELKNLELIKTFKNRKITLKTKDLKTDMSIIKHLIFF